MNNRKIGIGLEARLVTLDCSKTFNFANIEYWTHILVEASVEVTIRKEEDVYFVNLKGRVDYDTIEPFHQTCMNYLLNEKVVFNFSDLSFVGSSGITPLVETIQKLSLKGRNKLKFCGLKTEFRRIFMANIPSGLEVYEDEARAQLSFALPESHFAPAMPDLLDDSDDAV